MRSVLSSFFYAAFRRKHQEPVTAATYDIHIAGPQCLERPLNTRVHILRTVPAVIALAPRSAFLLFLRDLHPSKLGCYDHIIPHAPLFHPLANPLLAFTKLVVDGRIDEVAALLVEVVEHGEGCLLGTFAESGFPSFTEVHGAEAERRDADAGCWAENAMSSQEGDRACG
jgi:hypothetical protein